jgi:hypothetical protein
MVISVLIYMCYISILMIDTLYSYSLLFVSTITIIHCFRKNLQVISGPRIAQFAMNGWV